MLRVNVLGTRKPLDFHLGIPVAATQERPALVDGGDPGATAQFTAGRLLPSGPPWKPGATGGTTYLGELENVYLFINLISKALKKCEIILI